MKFIYKLLIIINETDYLGKFCFDKTIIQISSVLEVQPITKDNNEKDIEFYLKKFSNVLEVSNKESKPSSFENSNQVAFTFAETTFSVKIALLGDGAVGKTSLRRSYLGETFTFEYLLTLGADFSTKTVNLTNPKANTQQPVKFQIWDLSGQIRFTNVRQGYYNGCMGALLIFDRSRPETLDSTMHWLQELWKNSGTGPVPFVLLGNKSDLITDNQNKKLDRKAKLWAETFTEETRKLKGFDVHYLQTSALTGQNVDKAFSLLGEQIFSWMAYQNKI